MNVKSALIAALSASSIGVIYTLFYYKILFDFSSVLPMWKVTFGLISFTLILFYVHELFKKILNQRQTFWFGLTFSIGSFLSILYPIMEKVYVDAAELYPGFVIPLHFLPMLMFYSYNSLDAKK